MLRLLFLLCIFSFKVSAGMCGNGSQGSYSSPPSVSSTAGLNEIAGQIRALLQIDSSLGDGNKQQQQPVEDQWTVVPPKYMLDLYHKYADEDFILETDPRLTTTVRCILGKVRREVVHFNLSSLADGGSVSRAEVHVFRRASRGKGSRTKFSLAQHRIRLRNLPKKYLSTIISLMPSRGWQAVDITSTIKTSLGRAKLLSMTVEASIPEFGTGRARYHTVPVDEVLRVAYRPFLVIFSYSEPGLGGVPSVPSATKTTTLSSQPAPSSSSTPLPSSSSYSFSLLGSRKDETMPNERKHSYYRYFSTNPPTIDNSNYGALDNLGENFDELENSLKTILNVDKMTGSSNNGGELLSERTNNLVDRDVGGLENNEIGESNTMDHFHFFRSLDLSKSMVEIPLINHSNSVVKKRSIENNEFPLDEHEAHGVSLRLRHPQQERTGSESPHHSSSWNDPDDDDDDADDPNLISNSLDLATAGISNTRGGNRNQFREKELLLRQDNLQNELSPSSSSSSSPSLSSIPSAKEQGNLNPILPYPWRNRWWNEPLDRYWTSLSSSKSRSRRRGKTNRRKKLRANRQERKKYWTTKGAPPPPTLPSLTVTKSLITDAEQLNKVADPDGRGGGGGTRRISNCRVEELSVDTANFDWAERIIAPAVFPLNFCHGSCFHLQKYEEMDGLAVEGEEVDLRRNPDFDYPSISSTSGPCCSPSQKKRFVVLYSDIHDNIVLQIHPNVTTESCKCV